MRGAGVARGVAREGRGARVLAVMRVQPSCSRECSRPLTAGSHCCRLRRLSRRRRALPLLAGRCAAGTRPVIAFAESPHCAPLFGRTALAQPNVTPKKQISRLTALPLRAWGRGDACHASNAPQGGDLSVCAEATKNVAYSCATGERLLRMRGGSCAHGRRWPYLCMRVDGAPACFAWHDGASLAFEWQSVQKCK